MVFIYNHRGDFEKSSEYARELIKIGVESGDRQLKGWGLGAKGFCKTRTGDFEEAVCNLNQSKTLLESIPDYYALIPTLTDLMSCYLLSWEKISVYLFDLCGGIGKYDVTTEDKEG